MLMDKMFWYKINYAHEFKCITRGYQKVRRLMPWNQYFLSYAYKFSREYYTTNVLLVVKIWAIYVDN